MAQTCDRRSVLSELASQITFLPELQNNSRASDMKSWSSVETTDTTQWHSVMSWMFRLAGGRRSTTSCNQLFLHSQWSSSRCLCISRILLWLTWTWWSVQGRDDEIIGLCLRGDAFTNKRWNHSTAAEWNSEILLYYVLLTLDQIYWTAANIWPLSLKHDPQLTRSFSPVFRCDATMWE